MKIHNENIANKIGFFYTHQTRTFNQLRDAKTISLHSLDLYDANKNWKQLRDEVNLSEFSLIFLDGGNQPRINGIELLGDEIADYVDNGGIVCTMGPSNAKDSHYSIKGRWKNEKYQPVHGIN
jgi:hypothetical protein